MSNNKIQITLIGLSRLKGVGQKTLSYFYDSGLVENYSELSNTDIYSIIENSPNSLPIESVKTIANDKAKIFDEGKSISLICSESDIKFTHCKSTDYPEKLLDIENFPRWFFYKGNLSRTADPIITSIIGTRDFTTQGMDLTRYITNLLVDNSITTLSGLAKGIDYFSHEATVNKKGKNIAVIAHGLIGDFKSYPNGIEGKILENDGLIISEYFPFQHPVRSYFLRRNELVAALSDFVIPIEMPDLNSGTASTVRRAMKLHRKVIALEPIHKTDSLIKTYQNLLKLNSHPVSIDKDVFLSFFGKSNILTTTKENYIFSLKKYIDTISSSSIPDLKLNEELEKLKAFLFDELKSK